MIDAGAGKLGGHLAEATVGRLAHHSARQMAERGVKDVLPEKVIEMRDRIYINSMELFQRAPEAGAASLFKEGAKRLEAKTEEAFFSRKMINKSVKNSLEKKEILAESSFDSLREL